MVCQYPINSIGNLIYPWYSAIIYFIQHIHKISRKQKICRREKPREYSASQVTTIFYAESFKLKINYPVSIQEKFPVARKKIKPRKL